MRRRTFLASAAGAGALAGCTAFGGEETPELATTPPPSKSPTPTPSGTAGETATDLPDGVYVQRFRETMAMQGVAESGEFAAGLMYAAPHVFWNVNGQQVQKTPRSGDVHLMAVVWDPETETVLPEAGVSIEILRDGEPVTEEVIYPMLSQRMGFHYGANFDLAGDGEYVGRLSVGGLTVRRTGAYRGRFGESTTLEIPFSFTEAERRKVRTEELDAYGERGAVKPMEMGSMPQALAPPREQLPGVLGQTNSDDAVFVVGTTQPPEGVDGGTYLYASARTPYNRLVLPAMALSASVERDGETVFEGPLRRTFDPDLGYHYGSSVEDSIEDGDRVRLTPTTVPQVARHEGYERAFLRMEPAELSV